MRKVDAIAAFGGITKLARAIGMTRQAIWLWPDELLQTQADRIRGAAVRLGIEVPESEEANEYAPGG